MADDIEQISEFNMGLAFLYTLRNLLNTCLDSSSRGDSYNWYYSLLALNRELYDDMTEAQQETSTSYKETLHSPVMQATANFNGTGVWIITQELYNSLEQFELFLRQIMAKKGYKAKMQASAAKALRGG